MTIYGDLDKVMAAFTNQRREIIKARREMAIRRKLADKFRRFDDSRRPSLLHYQAGYNKRGRIL